MFVKNALAYTGTSLVSQFVALVQKLAVRRILPPSVMGIWELALVIQSVGATFDPGVNAAAAVELPLLAGSAARDEERRVRSAALLTALATSLVVGAGILVYTFAFLARSEAHAVSGIVACLVFIPTALGQCLLVFFQGRQKYVPLSKASLFHAGASAILLPAGAWAYGIGGLLVAGIVANAALPVILYAFLRREGLAARPLWEPATFKRLLAFGLPLRLADYPQGILFVVDSLFVSALLGTSALAVYAIAKSFFLQVAAIPGRIGNVVVMRSFHMSGAQVSRRVVAQDVRRFLLLQNCVLHPALICGIVPAYQLIVLRFIPSYAASIPLIGVMALSVYFSPQTTIVRNFWMLDRRLGALAVSNLFGLAATAASILVTVQVRGLSAHSVAVGTVLGYGAYYLHLMLTAGRDLWGLRTTLGVVTHALLGLGLTKLVIDWVPPAEAGALDVQLWWLVAAWGRSFAALAPLLLYGAWKTDLLSYLGVRLLPGAREDEPTREDGGLPAVPPRAWWAR